MLNSIWVAYFYVVFGTDLIYADGHFAWTRPVTDSFVIVARNQQFTNQLTGINPSPYGYTAEANLLGPAVVPDLNSYTVSKLLII
jgi:outer membrane usher protein